jgi:hypothetical protein
MATAQEVIEACTAEWNVHKSDCSGFVKAVGRHFNVQLNGLADDIVDQISTGQWKPLPDGSAAAASAATGAFVVAGLKGADESQPSAHGHVVVVVAGPLARGAYPTAYWGKLGGGGCQDQTLNFAWKAADRDRVTYAMVET